MKEILERIEEKLDKIEKRLYDSEIKVDKCYLIARKLAEKV